MTNSERAQEAIHDVAKNEAIKECMGGLKEMQIMLTIFNEAAFTDERAAAIILEAAKLMWPSKFEEVR
tara:strand:+ start:121 stop:324 length:204 start_codon:yes stop_codon:yes gene_type:complete